MKTLLNSKFELSFFLWITAQPIAFVEQPAHKLLVYFVCSKATNFAKGSILSKMRKNSPRIIKFMQIKF